MDFPPMVIFDSFRLHSTAQKIDQSPLPLRTRRFKHTRRNRGMRRQEALKVKLHRCFST